MTTKPIPVTVFTGFLGSGKTTLIQSLLSTYPNPSSICILKNEFGNANTDSELLKSYNVSEIINGCLCCVLVGQIKTALLDLKAAYPLLERIIVETSGSAFPAPLSIQIRAIPEFSLDSIITVSTHTRSSYSQVIDCVNFEGYEDKSYTAKLQAQYTDLIFMNKSEGVSEEAYDRVLDRVNDLNTETPKVRVMKGESVSSELIFGIDTRLFMDVGEDLGMMSDHHFNEVDLIQILVDARELTSCGCDDAGHDHVKQPYTPVSKTEFESLLNGLDKEDVFRVKGFIRLDGSLWILNWAFGRYTLDVADAREGLDIRLTVMGHLNKFLLVPLFSAKLDVDRTCIEFIERGNRT